MHILVHIEIHQNVIAGSSRELVAAARRLAGTEGKISALVAHASPDQFKGQIGGVDETVVISDVALAEYNPEAQLACLQAAIAAGKPDLVLLAYTSAGMDLGPALSAQSSAAARKLLHENRTVFFRRDCTLSDLWRKTVC